MIVLIAGPSPETRRVWEAWVGRVSRVGCAADPPKPVPKQFKPKWPEIVQLESYEAAPPQAWWDAFPCNDQDGAESLIDLQRLDQMVSALGCGNRDRLHKLRQDLREGADIGCTGIYRGGSVSGNAPSAVEYGPQVTDAVASWVGNKFVFGPVEDSEVPAGAKITGLLV